MTNIDYLYNPEAAKPVFEKNYFIDKKLGFQVIEHGTVLPYKNSVEGLIIPGGGLIDSKGSFIKGSSFRSSVVNGAYTPPQNQFNTDPKQSFISDFSFLYGDIS